jgi:uncharacterized protein (TIGR02285 family)
VWQQVILLSCLSFFAVAEPLDVQFHSKMSPDWLTQEPAGNESLELSLMRLIFAHNTVLRPDFALVNHTKASELTRTSSNSCMASILKNPQREAEFLFSKPFSAIEGLKLYLPADSRLHQRLQTKSKQWGGKARLRELLLTEPDFIIGLDMERSYGSDLDLLFKENAVSRNLYFKQSGAQIAQLWPMLKQHRVSAVLEYPFMLATTDASKLEGYSVAEAEPLQLAYFACNKSETGQAIINQLNQSIEVMAGTQAYLDLHLKTVPTERREDFIRLYRASMLLN